MSFLWKANNVHTDPLQNSCKNCIDKNKRIADYELFFNETKDILKKKDEDLLDAQTRLSEQLKKIEDLEVISQAQMAFREKLIEQYELCKKIYAEEKKQWIEERNVWSNEKQSWVDKSVEWENEKSDFEDKLDTHNDHRIMWKQHHKVLEDKIQVLLEQIAVLESKNTELIKLMEIQEDKHKDKEEKLLCDQHMKIESIIDEYIEKEMEWKQKEAEYEYVILEYQDNDNEYEMKIQDLKYEMEEKLQDLEKEYKIMESNRASQREEIWEQRIQELNDKYDQEFIEFKETLKRQQQKLENEKEEMEKVLKDEIEKLKLENIKLEEGNKDLEKKRIDLTIENRGLVADNKWLEKEWKDGQQEIQNLNETKEKLELQQKKIEESYENLKKDKLNEEIKVNSIATQTLKEIEQKIKSNLFDPNMDLVDIVQNDVESQFEENEIGLRKRNIKKKNQNGKNMLVTPSVECMNKNDNIEKKNIIIEQQENKSNDNSNLFVNQTSSYSDWIDDSTIIDMPESNDLEKPASYDTNNFFLRIVGLVKSVKNNEHSEIDTLKTKNSELQNQIEEYQLKTEKLQEMIKGYQTKINRYECNSIIELNRKLRTGVPVHFYPYHSNHQILNTSHIHSVDLDLH